MKALDRESARLMREDGYLLREIAAEFGVSNSTVVRWTNDASAARQRAASRAAKERYRGECVDCGASTNGCNGPGKASERCDPCARAAGLVWTRETVVAAIRRFGDRYGRPPAATDFSPANARAQGHEWRAERFAADGDYPHLHSVRGVFGSWAGAVEAAGLPRPIVGVYERDGRRGAHLAGERGSA